MFKIKDHLRSPHIQISITAGISILVLAYFSKRVLSEPIGYLALAIPPFIATIYESVYKKYKGSRIVETRYWISAIAVATCLVIALS